MNSNQSSRRRFKRRRLIDEGDDYIQSELRVNLETKKNTKRKNVKGDLVQTKILLNLQVFFLFLKTMIKIWSYELCPLSTNTMKEFYHSGKYCSKFAIDLLKRLSYAPFLVFRFTRYLYLEHWTKFSFRKRILITCWFTCQLMCFWQKYEAGVLFFTISLLTLITTVGLDHSEVEEGSISAYSVFNKGCERLLGTYNVEEWERIIRHTPEE